jgi:molecular chaperone HtpG
VARLKTETADADGWANLLFDQAQLAEGTQLADPAGFVKRLNDMLLAMATR